MKTHKQVSGLRSHLGFWMRLVSNQVSHSFAQKVERCGVTVAEWVVLREMYEHASAMPPSEVANLTGLTRGAISKLVDRLQKKKLIKREFSTEDRRCQDIELTPSAMALVPKLGGLADLNDKEFFSSLSKKQKEDLVDMLQHLARENKINKVPTE